MFPDTDDDRLGRLEHQHEQFMDHILRRLESLEREKDAVPPVAVNQDDRLRHLEHQLRRLLANYAAFQETVRRDRRCLGTFLGLVEVSFLIVFALLLWLGLRLF